MDNTIILSIIIPAYNVEQYIKRCLHSCVNQNLSADLYEIIVVNDGSTDRTKDYICEFKNKYHNYNIFLINKKNEGISNARNDGIQIAKGKYLWFVDGDDYITSNILEKLYDKLNTGGNDIIWMNYEIFNNENKIIDKPWSHMKDIPEITYTGDQFLLKYYRQTDCMVWLYFIKRELLIENNIYFKFRYNEDFLFTPKVIYLSKKIEYIDFVAYHYFFRQNSSTKNNGLKSERSLDYIRTCNDLLYFTNTIIMKKKIAFWFTELINVNILMTLRESINDNKKELYSILYQELCKTKMIPLKIQGTFKRKSLLFVLNHSKSLFFFICKYII